MRNSVVIGAIILIVVGAILLLGSLGVVVINWGVIIALVLFGIGAWLIWGALTGPRSFEVEEASVPLAGAAQARIHIRHGAARLNVGSGAAPGQLTSGRFAGGLDCRTSRVGDLLDVNMSPKGQGLRWTMPWTWSSGRLDWTLMLSPEIPLVLELDTGASDTQLNLKDLRVSELRLKTGASSNTITLPASAGSTRVEIKAGASSVDIRVPDGVAARIRSRGGASSTNVDRSRFVRSGSGYASPDYDTATNKADIEVEIGAGSVDVR